MTISLNLSSRISELIQEFSLATAPDPLKLRDLAAAENVLPLIWDMGGVFAINPGGDVVSFSFSLTLNGQFVAYPWEKTEPPRIETDLRIRNNALFGGSKKYPELEPLIEKPDDARVCPHCGGTGIDSYAEKLNTNAIVCYCGGLGWIP